VRDGTLEPGYGTSFDEVAAEYDRRRSTYPPQLIDRALEVAEIGPGDRVLEIGCGTGQLTGSLLARAAYGAVIAAATSLQRHGVADPTLPLLDRELAARAFG